MNVCAASASVTASDGSALGLLAVRVDVGDEAAGPCAEPGLDVLAVGDALLGVGELLSIASRIIALGSSVPSSVPKAELKSSSIAPSGRTTASP